MDEQHCLVGKTITGIQVADDRMAIRFVTADGEVIANCDADCCSHTWVENIELPALGFPALVTAARDLDMKRPDEGEHGDQVTSFYGFVIETDRGAIVIDYRNSSNGYYGGNLSWPDSGYFYGGVYGQNNSKCEWQDVSP